MKLKLILQLLSFVGSWFGLLVSALACAVQMYLAGTFPLVPGLVAMGTYHFIIGLVGEGLITAVAISAIASSRPDLLENKSLANRSAKA